MEIHVERAVQSHVCSASHFSLPVAAFNGAAGELAVCLATKAALPTRG